MIHYVYCHLLIRLENSGWPDSKEIAAGNSVSDFKELHWEVATHSFSTNQIKFILAMTWLFHFDLIEHFLNSAIWDLEMYSQNSVHPKMMLPSSSHCWMLSQSYVTLVLRLTGDFITSRRSGQKQLRTVMHRSSLIAASLLVWMPRKCWEETYLGADLRLAILRRCEMERWGQVKPKKR